MDKRIKRLFEIWQKRQIVGLWCETKEAAAQKLLEIIPPDATVGISGSVTLVQVGIVRLLEERGTPVFNQYKAGMSQQESQAARAQGVAADFYLASANAVSEDGELVFLSAYGNRIAGVACAKNVLVICGINKISKNLAQAQERARNYAAPLNCKRLKWNTPCFSDGACRQELCVFPEHKRMCCQILIIEAGVVPGRLKVLLVGEELGF